MSRGFGLHDTITLLSHKLKNSIYQPRQTVLNTNFIQVKYQSKTTNTV